MPNRPTETSSMPKGRLPKETGQLRQRFKPASFRRPSSTPSFPARISTRRANGPGPSPTILAIEIAMLVVGIVGLAVATWQLRATVLESRGTQLSLLQILGVQGQELDVLREMQQLQAASATGGPEATANASHNRMLEATLEALQGIRADIYASAVPPSAERDCEAWPIQITEVMSVPVAPWGDKDLEAWNEYVELRNLSPNPIQLQGLLLADSGGHADAIVPWDVRYPGIPIGEAVTSTTILPPNGSGIVLPALYERGDRPYDAEIPDDAIVLTLEENDLIGDGIRGQAEVSRDVVVLYFGTQTQVRCIVSTYGSPARLALPFPASRVADDGADGIPPAILEGAGWGGAERVAPIGVDTQSNWKRLFWNDRSPGS